MSYYAEAQKKYQQSAKGKARLKKYHQSEKGKEALKQAKQKYEKSKKAKETRHKRFLKKYEETYGRPYKKKRKTDIRTLKKRQKLYRKEYKNKNPEKYREKNRRQEAKRGKTRYVYDDIRAIDVNRYLAQMGLDFMPDHQVTSLQLFEILDTLGAKLPDDFVGFEYFNERWSKWGEKFLERKKQREQNTPN